MLLIHGTIYHLTFHHCLLSSILYVLSTFSALISSFLNVFITVFLCFIFRCLWVVVSARAFLTSPFATVRSFMRLIERVDLSEYLVY